MFTKIVSRKALESKWLSSSWHLGKGTYLSTYLTFPLYSCFYKQYIGGNFHNKIVIVRKLGQFFVRAIYFLVTWEKFCFDALFVLWKFRKIMLVTPSHRYTKEFCVFTTCSELKSELWRVVGCHQSLAPIETFTSWLPLCHTRAQFCFTAAVEAVWGE